MSFTRQIFVAVLLSVFMFCGLGRAELLLKQGQLLSIVGDSITEEKDYSRFIEDYITCCYPQLKVKCLLMGWSGEVASGFLRRMNNDLIPFKPDVATTCYGMNDGGYQKYNDSIGKGYETAMNGIVNRLKENKVLVLVGSPGAVDTYYYDKKSRKATAEVYNENLGKLSEIAKKVAQDNQMPYVEVHEPLMTVMANAKKANGETFAVCGTDGIHPTPNGHIVMAQCFLKGLGFDGNIGTFTVDMKGKTEASEGHKVLSAKDGKVEIESSRYPFCFYGKEKDAESTASILPFVTFNQELNRLMLVVRNFDGAKAKVIWGEESKSFTKEQLEKGINLAAEFVKNPFSKPFRNMDAMILEKQSYETEMIKNYITRMQILLNDLEEGESDKPIMEKKEKMLKNRERKISKISESFVPVTHTIEIVKE